MATYVIHTTTEDETKEIARRLGDVVAPGTLLTLEGDLGAGKTTFVKGLAIGLSIQEIVNSPTFTIIKEYEGRLPLYHMDAYRLEGEEDDLGLDEYVYGQGVTVIEWPEYVEEVLPEQRVSIAIAYTENGRTLTFKAVGQIYEDLCREALS
ncbi:tRNA (adenosine(37)-N6)-threonylcarbamoyltransferase complex ATPase subunit type 1 TsaE [Aureibacillus halotolerans]|uniref:tRNA threonylcarbamoyladenosine biosynthesis protein TsaE n=1 Tax=Aureibacillus halotolerans TaxID=1508390 RepID=A0A4R6TRY6_9BACI|nr:tRNA (adenosine(37)-N6)-threonylcarbamoyltransferase complex ATPase subunit type 1 TsaE [Aureibacillus halotolerans]TDQ35217.1 tRNA threonylcarbamoyladenosine biosynthesis protein TsaE [Aureibacillus halotolerans]